MDRYKNAIFPHYDHEKLMGYEIKNFEFTGFASGGSKALWLSKAFRHDNVLVLAESTINALSYAALHDNNFMRYGSVGGSLNYAQISLIIKVANAMPDKSKIVFAFDQDDGGNKILSRLEEHAVPHFKNSLTWEKHFPLIEGYDWNDVLKASFNKEKPHAG